MVRLSMFSMKAPPIRSELEIA